MTFDPFVDLTRDCNKPVDDGRSRQPGDQTRGPRCQLLAGHTCRHLHRLDLLDDHQNPELKADIDAAIRWQENMKAWTRWDNLAPGRFGKVDFDTLDQPAAIREHIKPWLGRCINCEPNGCLVFMGPVGTGKSWAAYSVARAVSDEAGEHGYDIRLTTAGLLLRSLRPGGGATIEDYCDADLVLIDDLGTEKSSDWTDEILFTIFDRRWSDQRSTIITTNLAPAALRAAVGDRIYDRIRDGATALTLTGPSRRSGSIIPITGEDDG